MVKIMENPIKMDDLEVPLFLETPNWVSISKNQTWWLMYHLTPPQKLTSDSLWTESLAEQVGWFKAKVIL